MNTVENLIQMGLSVNADVADDAGESSLAELDQALAERFGAKAILGSILSSAESAAAVHETDPSVAGEVRTLRSIALSLASVMKSIEAVPS